jgi:hypothetical protein
LRATHGQVSIRAAALGQGLADVVDEVMLSIFDTSGGVLRCLGDLGRRLLLEFDRHDFSRTNVAATVAGSGGVGVGARRGRSVRRVWGSASGRWGVKLTWRCDGWGVLLSRSLGSRAPRMRLASVAGGNCFWRRAETGDDSENTLLIDDYRLSTAGGLQIHRLCTRRSRARQGRDSLVRPAHAQHRSMGRRDTPVCHGGLDAVPSSKGHGRQATTRRTPVSAGQWLPADQRHIRTTQRKICWQRRRRDGPGERVLCCTWDRGMATVLS